MAINDPQGINIFKRTDRNVPVAKRGISNDSTGVKPKNETPVEPTDQGIDPTSLKQPGKSTLSKQERVEAKPEGIAQEAVAPKVEAKKTERTAPPTTLITLDEGPQANGTSAQSFSPGFSLVAQLGLENSSGIGQSQPVNGLTQATGSLPRTNTGTEFAKTFVYADTYDQDRIDLPFAYPSSDGKVELNDVGASVRGLRHLGAHGAARGVLENVLDLGERYTALPGKNELNEVGRSGMPTISGPMLDEAKSNPDPEFLPRAYKVLSEDMEQNWGNTYFKATPNGLNRFCDVDYSHDATLAESGGPKNEARFDGDPMPFNPIDLNANLYRTEKDLQSMATMMEARSKESGDLEGAKEWKTQADEWGQKAQSRKDEVIDLMWDSEEGLFFDHKYKAEPPSRSEVKTLAAFSVLDAEMLDTTNPKEKKIADALVGSLDAFQQPGDVPVWDTKGGKAAEPADVMMVASGLEKYGHKEKATGLRRTLKTKLDARPELNSPTDLAAKAMLENPTPPAAKPVDPEKPLAGKELGGFMSAKGLQGLQRLSAGFAGEVKVAAKDAGKLDRRIRNIHSSLKEPEMVGQLQKKGISELVYGVREENGLTKSIDLKVDNLGPARELKKGEAFDLGGVKIQTGLEGAQVRTPQKDVAVISKGGKNLVMAKVGDKVVIGDRAYSTEDFPEKAEDGSPQVRIDKDILRSFNGGGKQPDGGDVRRQSGMGTDSR